MKSIRSALFVILLLPISSMLMASMDTTGFAQMTAKENAELEQIMIETAKKLNAQTPMMVDKETRLDAVICSGLVLHYKCTLVNLSQAEDDIDLKVLKSEMKKQFLNNQCKDENIVKTLRVGVEYYYNYFDKDGYLLATGVVNRKNCGF
jgi:hypothetical protein